MTLSNHDYVLYIHISSHLQHPLGMGIFTASGCSSIL